MSKIIDINDRVPERRRKRKIRTNLKFSILIALFLLCIFVLLYFQSPYSKVNTIDVTGQKLLTAEEYVKLSGINENESLWDIKVKKVQRNLEKYEWIQSATVKRKWLNKVSIKVKEWPKVAYFERNGNYYPLLENGYVFEEFEENSLIDAPLFIQFEDESLRKKVLKQLAMLKPEVLSLISQINLNATESDPYRIILYMNDGYEVRAEITTLAEKLNYYPSIVTLIEQSNYGKGVIDIEVGSYYRPYSGEYDAISIPSGELNKGEDVGGEEGNE